MPTPGRTTVLFEEFEEFERLRFELCRLGKPVIERRVRLSGGRARKPRSKRRWERSRSWVPSGAKSTTSHCRWALATPRRVMVRNADESWRRLFFIEGPEAVYRATLNGRGEPDPGILAVFDDTVASLRFLDDAT